MFDKAFVEEVKARCDIVAVVAPHVELKKVGSSMQGLCPFHAEKKPSFSVNPARQFYYCFGCGASGDAIKFLMEHLGLNFMDAVADLATSVGMRVPEAPTRVSSSGRRAPQASSQAPSPATAAATARELKDAMREVEQHYRSNLRAAVAAVTALKAQGMKGETAALFGLGFASAERPLLDAVHGKVDPRIMRELGILEVSEHGEMAEALEGRITLPIHDINGAAIGMASVEVINGMTGRVHAGNDTALFKEERDLFGMPHCREGIRKAGCAILLKAQCMEVMALRQLGVSNVVSTVSGKWTAKHLTSLGMITRRVVMVLDESQDAADDEAAAIMAASGVEAGMRDFSLMRLREPTVLRDAATSAGTRGIKQILSGSIALGRSRTQ